MYAQQSSKTRFCSHCKSIGKTYAEYSSHYVRKTPDPNSRLTCPELLKNICKNCPSPNHTWNRCPLKEEARMKEKLEFYSSNMAFVTDKSPPMFEDNTGYGYSKPATKPAPPATKPAPPTNRVAPLPTKNRFSGLEEEEQQMFDPRQLNGLTPENQKLCIGEEIYAKVFENNRARAGLITGMFLEFDISDLVKMFNTPETFNATVAEANRILDIAV
jgi:hypothetical protein